MTAKNSAFREYCEGTLGKSFSRISDEKKLALRKLFDEASLKAQKGKEEESYTWIAPK